MTDEGTGIGEGMRIFRVRSGRVGSIKIIDGSKRALTLRFL